MNYSETRDLIRSLTKDLKVISENFDALSIMFQTDSEGNPTEDAKSQLFFDQRNFLAKQALPRDMKELSQKFIESISGIEDYIENWCDKPSDPDINSLIQALDCIINKQLVSIENRVLGYDDFRSDCSKFYYRVLKKNKGARVSNNQNASTKEMLRNNKAFKEAVSKEKIKDDGVDIVWLGLKQELVKWLFDNQLIERNGRQWYWAPWDSVFKWFNKKQDRTVSITTKEFTETVKNLRESKGWEPDY